MSDRRAPRSFGSILTAGDTALARVACRSEALRRLQQRLEHLLPMPLRDHCQVANARGRTLIVYADSAVWATQLRFLSDTLSRELLGEGGGHVKIRVRPPASTPRARRRPRPRLSPQGAKALEAAADDLGEGALAQALRRLAGRAR